jgi:D-alanyl-lipoteichoic acid acyltransferase DltB (MBOAT superfamily)
MLFNSYTFILFFIAVFTTYQLPINWSKKKYILLFSSYIFYSAWNPPFVLLLGISTAVDWWAAKKIFQNRHYLSTKRHFLLISLLINLGFLGFFKYSNFLLHNFIYVVDKIGITFTPAIPDIILPVGISFYTFQTLSYTIDIYRGKGKPWHSLLDYALYVSFFPQLVAGPIVRAFSFLPQCLVPKRVSGEQIAWGISLIILGLFEKIVVADGLLAPVADTVYAVESYPGLVDAWCGTLAFTGQIFCDFAGYSTCAIGAAKCLGFDLPENFRYPYASLGFRDFWRRWHISLSFWLRDYLYVSLGGNRRGMARTCFNVMITMLLGGLWHGASWTFVVWGGVHAFLILAEHLIRRCIPTDYQSGLFLTSAAGILTFAGVCISWTFFRAHSMDQAAAMLQAMFGFRLPVNGSILITPDRVITISVISIMVFIHWLLRNRSLKEVSENAPWWIRSIGIGIMLVAMATFSGEDRAFIYFQF